MECVFCSIAQGKIPALKIYEDGTSIAFLDINPASKGHVVITYKKHYERMSTIPQEEVISQASAIKFIAGIVENITKPKGMHLITNIGEVKNQQTTHIATHMIPLQGKEEIVIGWKPEKIEQAEFQKFAEQLELIIQKEIQTAQEKLREQAKEIIKTENIDKVIKELKIRRGKQA